MNKRQYLALLMTLVMLLSVASGSMASTVTVKDGDVQALSALQSIYDDYLGGTPVDGAYGNYSSYEAYLLMEAGVDLDVWTIEGVSFEDDVRALIGDSVSSPKAANAKRLAQDYAAAVKMGMSDEAVILMAEISARQTTAGTGGLDSNAYVDLPAYDMLLRTETVTPGALNLTLAVDYVLGSQESDSGWPAGWPDFMSTAQAIRVLAILDGVTDYRNDEIASAVAEGKAWMMAAQQADGSFTASGWDDALVDTAEAVYTAIVLGEDPAAWANDHGISPVDYLLAEDWSVILSNSYGNAVSRTWGLDAYILLGYEASDVLMAIYTRYTTGTPVDAGYGNFSGYDVAVLVENGMDPSAWAYEETTVTSDAALLIETSLDTGNTTGDFGSYNTSAKRIAQDAYAAKMLGMTAETAALVDLLEARQNTDGSLDGGAYGIYSDFPAYDILLRAGLLVESDLDMAAIVNYMTGSQDTTGAWPIADEAMWIANDFMSTNQAVRVLSGVRDVVSGYDSEIDSAIDSGLAWLQEQQQPDGSYMAGWDDPVVDTADMIYTAVILGEDANQWTSDTGNSPIDFFKNNTFQSLLALSTGNIPSCTAILDAGVQTANIVLSAPDDSDSTADTAKVHVYVIGEDGEVLYGPSRVTLDEEDTFGLTAMSALDATGLNWSFSDEYPDFIEEIEGQTNQGFSGWMYAVNGDAPSVLAVDKEVESGDEVIWWFSSSSDNGVPEWPSSNSDGTASTLQIGVTIIDEEAIKETLTATAEMIEEKPEESLQILNADNPMSDVQAEALRMNLEANTVRLSGSFTGEDMVVADREIQMLVPADALDEDTTITVDELAAESEPESFGIRLQGDVYEFGPDGTTFDEPVTIAIKVAIDSDTDLDSLTPAWYDEDLGVWVPIPGVVDLETGLVTFTVDHFTKFAVLELAERISFSDMASYEWALDAVEILAGEGYIAGTGDGYEPGRQINRAEFTKIMTMALGYEVPEVRDMAFGDVAEASWYAPYVEAARINGLVEGDDDGNFRPDDSISRQEAVTILARAATDELPDTYAITFDDAASVPDWAVAGVTFAAYSGIIEGDPDGSFYGERSMTRAEAAVIIYRYLTYKMDL